MRVSRFAWLWLFLTFSGALSAAPTHEIQFLQNGELVKKLTLDDMKKLAPAETLKVYEDHEKSDETFKAIPFLALLSKIYGKKIDAADEILFTCLDGYQPTVPLAKLRAHQSYLAYEKANGKPFRFEFVEGAKKEMINYGPFYLIWENIKDAKLRETGNPDWPFQITSIDLIEFSVRFAALMPPASSSASAKRGFLAYRHQCIQCHTLNGAGGNLGHDLNYPANITEYMRVEWLRKWISDPTSVRFNATMPAVNKDLPDREQVISDIISYLKAMKGNKRAPKS